MQVTHVTSAKAAFISLEWLLLIIGLPLSGLTRGGANDLIGLFLPLRIVLTAQSSFSVSPLF
jgi:hypothetical protein